MTPPMDRARIERWLRSDHRTWRWRPDEDDPDRYEAVESTDAGFRYFAWSHLHGEDGRRREDEQSFEDFDARGPAWAVPPEIEREMRQWLARRRG